MGRRERLKVEVSADTKGTIHEPDTTSNNAGGSGVIQLTDEILGYGGHGTIVYVDHFEPLESLISCSFSFHYYR
jgi:hypothetical protein